MHEEDVGRLEIYYMDYGGRNHAVKRGPKKL
jgi:hypothetical protein